MRGASVLQKNFSLHLFRSLYTTEGLHFEEHRDARSRRSEGEGGMMVSEGLQELMSRIWERSRQSFMENDEPSDVTFIVGPGKVNVPGHKTILSIRSPVFRALFYGPLRRVNDEGQGPTIVEIPDMEPEAFTNFMSFLHRDELADGNEGTAEDYLELLYLANKYRVPGLSRLCVQELREKIQLDNVLQVCESAVLCGEIELKNWCLQYMNRMSQKIIKTPRFLQLEPSMLSVFLESDGLAASEQELHRAVLRWAEAKVRRDGEERSPESIRNAMGDLIYLIRFPTMSAMEFSKEEPVSVLRRKEIVEIYRLINCKDAVNESRFGTRKRRPDYNLYRCSPKDYLEPLAGMYYQMPLCRPLRFKLRTDKRIYLKGVSVSSILYPNNVQNPLLECQIGLSVQVGDLPSVRTLSQIYCGVVELGMRTSRNQSRGPPTSCPIRAIVLDELCEVPANCAVTICVEVFRAGASRRNPGTDFDPMELPLREEVQVDCYEDERKVNFQFFSSSDDVIVQAMGGLPDILFSL